jgi:hypothetical protein
MWLVRVELDIGPARLGKYRLIAATTMVEGKHMASKQAHAVCDKGDSSLKRPMQEHSRRYGEFQIREILSWP